jgi:hypothetical protein
VKRKQAFEGAERLNANLEERAIDVVEGHKANKGTERLTSSRERGPISDQIEFGLGRTVAIRSDVVADILLDPVGEKFTLLQLKSDTVLHKDRANAFEVCQESVQRRGSMMVLLPLLAVSLGRRSLKRLSYSP